MSSSGVNTDRVFEAVPDFEVAENGQPVLERFHPADLTDKLQQRVRERAVAVEQVSILREELAACYRREGVNHYQNCKELVQAYHTMLKTPHYGAFKPNVVSRIGE